MLASPARRAVQERGIYAASTRAVFGRWNNLTPFAVRKLKRRERHAPGEPDAGNQNLVADFQRADFFFGEWKTQICHGCISIQTRPKVQRVEAICLALTS
jgi:hypothetical protein